MVMAVTGSWGWFSEVPSTVLPCCRVSVVTRGRGRCGSGWCQVLAASRVGLLAVHGGSLVQTVDKRKVNSETHITVMS